METSLTFALSCFEHNIFQSIPGGSSAICFLLFGFIDCRFIYFSSSYICPWLASSPVGSRLEVFKEAVTRFKWMLPELGILLPFTGTEVILATLAIPVRFSVEPSRSLLSWLRGVPSP